MEEYVLEKANELYTALENYSDEALESGQFWNVADTKVVLSRLISGLEEMNNYDINSRL